jgi:hypothetical protein
VLSRSTLNQPGICRARMTPTATSSMTAARRFRATASAWTTLRHDRRRRAAVATQLAKTRGCLAGADGNERSAACAWFRPAWPAQRPDCR